jgi:VIT1/CCC1 family predicted Fe2+/Mn2+ transporter
MPETKRQREFLQGEVDSAFLYRALAELEPAPALAELYDRLAATEERHAKVWHARLAAADRGPGMPRPSRRARILAWLARRFGARFVLPSLSEQEDLDQGRYDAEGAPDALGMAAEERSHARLLRTVSGGIEGATLARFEGRHRAIGGNALRAAVLGANDGLLSNFSLVMGVAGASLSADTILITGIAGLLAGAGSMALGEWISVQSSRELYARQIAIEAAELEQIPEEEREELALIYRAKGLDAEAADRLADDLLADRNQALSTLAREELGIDPDQLGGSPWTAAITSFGLFAVGAIIPVIPFLLTSGDAAIAISIAVSAAALFALGAATTLMTGRSVAFSGTRQLVIGLAAAAITFGIGSAVGGAVG